MHFYQMIAHRTGSPDALELAARLSAWPPRDRFIMNLRHRSFG